MCANAFWLFTTCVCNRTGVVLTPHSYETKVTNGVRKEEYSCFPKTEMALAKTLCSSRKRAALAAEEEQRATNFRVVNVERSVGRPTVVSVDKHRSKDENSSATLGGGGRSNHRRRKVRAAAGASFLGKRYRTKSGTWGEGKRPNCCAVGEYKGLGCMDRKAR